MQAQAGYNYKSMSASGLLKSGDGVLVGFTIASGTAVTIKVWDNTSAAGTVILDTTAALTPAGQFISVPANFGTGCYVTLGGTTPVVTAYWS